MKTIIGAVRKLTGIAALAVLLGGVAHAQNAIQFTGVKVTVEGAIQLFWASTTNEIYEIDYADQLNGNEYGTTAWQILYDNYPSQGTNTLWLDTGNYMNSPIIPHPKDSAMRFYRIVDLGADTAPEEPRISIGSPSAGAVVSDILTITVSAATDQAVIHTKLYVDGQEMPMRLTGSNYYDGFTNYITDTYAINTCEWGNGPHLLFGTAETYSTPEGLNYGTQPLIGHGVSPFVAATFSNLITSVAFSQYFFDPDSGQTQQVSAAFAANCNWTLDVIDSSSNVVRTATGSGSKMKFNFDGNNNSGTALPPGVYQYVVSAQTNGQAFSMDTVPLSSASAFSVERTELWAMPSDGSRAAVPLALYPPGCPTNGFIIFEASWSEMLAQRTPLLMASPMDSGTDGPTPMYSGAASQSTTAPTRPPTAPAIRVAGTVGVGYQRYLAWTNQYAPESPDNGLNLGQHIQMEGNGGLHPMKFHALGGYQEEANNFTSSMKNWAGWNTTLTKVDNGLGIGDLQGQTSPFNGVNLAVLLIHGTYGTSTDYKVSDCQQMYFAIASGAGGSYMRMSDMNLGGGGANGLKWMAIMACYSLQHGNWANMQNHHVKPYNANLHLLLGCDTTEYADPDMLAYWSRYMAWGITNNSPLTVHDAWFQAARDAYRYTIMPAGQTALTWAVAGDNACRSDTLRTNYNPTGTSFYDRNDIWTP